MDIEIRQLDVADTKAYRATRLEALKAFPQAYGASYAEARERPESSFENAIETSAVFGLFVNAKLSGIACFMSSNGEHDGHIGHIVQVYVDSQQQGRGLGQKLMAKMIEHARGRVKQIFLGVGTFNRGAIALYKNAGFEIYGTQPRALLVDGQYIDEYLMVKFLDA